VHANACLLTGGDYEEERAAGAWQAEWTPLSETLAHAGGAVTAIRESLESLEVDVGRMRANLSPDVYSERDRLGIDDADYLGTAPTFVERAVARWRGE
jgi:3-carboxy-cis,cis-muconate cycloisomerase